MDMKGKVKSPTNHSIQKATEKATKMNMRVLFINKSIFFLKKSSRNHHYSRRAASHFEDTLRH